MAKVRKNPADIANNQIARVQQSIPRIEAGVAAVTESPMDKAADNLDKAKANYIRAIDSGKTERGLRGVSLSEWKSKTIAKAGRISQGIEEARSVLVKFHTQRNGWQDEIDGKLVSMPTRTLQDNIQRMVTQITEMSKKTFNKYA